MSNKIGNLLTFNKVWRSRTAVRQLLPNRIKISNRLVSRLRHYDQARFDGIVDLVRRALIINPRLKSLQVDSPKKNLAIATLDLQKVSEEILQTCIRGNTLDLRGIHLRLEGYQAHIAHESTRPEISPPQYEQLGELVDVLGLAREAFRELPESSPPEKVFALINQVVNMLKFRNVSIYSPGHGGNWVRVFVSTAWAQNGGTKYALSHGGARPTTTLNSVIKGSERYYEVDIRDPETFTSKGLIPDLKSIADDLEHSKGPTKMIFIRVFSPSSGKLVGVVQINNRVQLKEKTIPETLPTDAKTLTLLETIFDEAALAIERTQQVKPKKSFPSRQTLPPPARGFDLFSFVQKITVPRPFGKYQVASLVGPSKLSRSEIGGVVKEIDWMGRGTKDMAEHAIYVDETRFAFDQNGEVAAFASINSLPYVYQARSGKMKAGSVIPLVGTAVKEGHRRKGLQVVLNFELILKRWLRLKFSKNIFRPLRVVARTYNPVVMQALYTHFRHVKFDGLNVEETAARQAFAERLECKVEENGVVRNAYEEPFPDSTNGFDVKGRIGRQIDAARTGLGPRDARIFVFKYTFWDILKTSLWLFYKGIRTRRRPND